MRYGDAVMWSQAELARDLVALGVGQGDAVMVHGSMRRVGPMIDGPDTLIAALRAALGADGTLLAYVNFNAEYEAALDATGRVPEGLKPHIPPFDPATTRASRDHGVLAEFIRTTPGAQRSGNPGASVAAIGAKAKWFTADHPLDYGYGPGSPFSKLVEAGGHVLMIGAPLDTMSLLHHAEHLARIPGKRVRRFDVPLLIDGQATWRMIEEFDTADPVVAGLADDYFATIVDDFLAQGGVRGKIGAADSVMVKAAEIVVFAVDWLEQGRAHGRTA